MYHLTETSFERSLLSWGVCYDRENGKFPGKTRKSLRKRTISSDRNFLVSKSWEISRFRRLNIPPWSTYNSNAGHPDPSDTYLSSNFLKLNPKYWNFLYLGTAKTNPLKNLQNIKSENSELQKFQIPSIGRELGGIGRHWIDCHQLNGMLRHSLGGAVNFISLRAHIRPELVKMPVFLSRQRREAIVRAFWPIRAQYESIRK